MSGESAPAERGEELDKLMTAIMEAWIATHGGAR